jgi:hypothetical protein
MTVDIYKDVGRNDPCPCGSGKKFKKCHMRTQQLEREAAKKKVSVEALVGAETLPYQVYLLLRQAQEDNLLAFFWDMLHDAGPLKARYADQAAFLTAADKNEAPVPAHPSLEMIRMRVDEPDVHLLLSKGVDDPREKDVTLEVVTLRRNGFDGEANPREVEHAGWRVWDVVTHHRAKDEVSEDGCLPLSELGVGWHERAFVKGSVYADLLAEQVAAGLVEGAGEEE